MKKIAVVTATRAEYGLLVPLISKLHDEPSIDMQLIVSGTHLLEKYGHTIDYIRQDNFDVSYEVPILDENGSSDEVQASKAVAHAVEQCGEIFFKEKYDALVVLGDRYELLGFCSAAVICRIPIIHIHGGEISEGAIDDKIRHAITKMSSIHFPSIKEYADRIIQMGENSAHVHAVGALGIDNAMHLNLIEKNELFEGLNIHTELPVAAVTYHPVTGSLSSSPKDEMIHVLDALYASGVYSVITMPNSDVGGDDIYKAIMQYCEQYPERFSLHKSLGQVRYLSLLKHADVMVGNSSSGILESASFALPTVNIGDRQKGRIAPKNVVHCICEKSAIEDAIMRCLSDDFKESLKGYVNPYGDGNAADRMLSVIMSTDFGDETLICKHFYDMG
ncbi:MAG: UDP-N-acetylglucosamine 2-epimerase (hydrolyzing) [Lachnospiraceae bacterium]|jgi:UDP-hydrolysing UDP-N-acetyl-D-glucosamine 2-epimerase|nr:UDP-N-acetylglucosamine 2-epimerase (hydrolyzing) [Lachnospiraceae bacterium]